MKQLDLTTDQRTTILKSFEDYILNTKDGEINFKYTPIAPATSKEKVTIKFTSLAYLKMNSLVQNCDKEIGWYGTVQKLDDITYLIDNILVYPQVVTAATVKHDDDKDALWLMSLDDDTVNRIRFQGHSHVHMGVTPSGQDDSNREEFLAIIQEDDFFIFAIVNKQGKINLWVYDRAKHVIFEPADCIEEVVDDTNEHINTWAKNSINDMVKSYVYVAPTTTPIITTSATNTPPTNITNKYSIQTSLVENNPNCYTYPSVEAYYAEQEALQAAAKSGNSKHNKAKGNDHVTKEQERRANKFQYTGRGTKK